jgi:hypothetical protein
MGSGVGGRFYHTLMLLYDGENLCFFACDVYVLKLICFKNSMYCDVLRYVTFTCGNFYVLKIFRTVMLRYVTFTFCYPTFCCSSLLS